MLANFFGKSKPINSVILYVMFLLLFFLAFFNGKINFDWKIIPFFIVIFGIVSFIVSKNNLTFDNSFMFLFFVLLLGFFPKVMTINTIFYSNLILLLFLRRMYSLKSSKTVFKKIFDAGFWLGIGFLLEPFMLLFAVLLYASMFLFQRLTLQTLFIPILGFFVPVFLYFTYCFWFDLTTEFDQLFYWTTDYDFSIYEHKNYIVSFFLIAFFLLITMVVKTPKVLSVKNSFRVNWILILLHFALALLLVLLIKNRNGSELAFIIFPIAIILANGLEFYQKKIAGNLTIGLFFVISVVMCFI